MFDTIRQTSELLNFFVPFTAQGAGDNVETWSGGTNPDGVYGYSIDTVNPTAEASGVSSPWGLPYGKVGTASAYNGDLSAPVYGFGNMTNAYECGFGTNSECS